MMRLTMSLIGPSRQLSHCNDKSGFGGKPEVALVPTERV
jgi:hypothetical protein